MVCYSVVDARYNVSWTRPLPRFRFEAILNEIRQPLWTLGVAGGMKAVNSSVLCWPFPPAHQGRCFVSVWNTSNVNPNKAKLCFSPSTLLFFAGFAALHGN